MSSSLHRSEEGHIVGGVCAALADRYFIDRSLVRLAFGLLALASGLGIMVYVLLWIVLPGANSQSSHLWDRMVTTSREIGPVSTDLMQSAARAWNRNEPSNWPRPLSRRWIGIGLVAVGGWLALGSLGLFDWIGLSGAVGIGAIVLGVALIMGRPEATRGRS